jgi:hypothetical protein
MIEEKNMYDYIFLIPGREFSINFINSWTNTLVYLHENGYTFASVFKYAPIIQEVRNQLLVNPIPVDNGNTRLGNFRRPGKNLFDNESYAKRIVFIDSDMVWRTEDIKGLLETDLDILCGAYFPESGEQTCILGQDGLFIDMNEIKTKSEPFEIMGAGMGFVSVKPEVLEKIGFPWFNTLYLEEEGGHTQFIGEDSFFFFRAAQEGYKIHCDPKLVVGHEKKKVISLHI